MVYDLSGDIDRERLRIDSTAPVTHLHREVVRTGCGWLPNEISCLRIDSCAVGFSDERVGQRIVVRIDRASRIEVIGNGWDGGRPLAVESDSKNTSAHGPIVARCLKSADESRNVIGVRLRRID